MFGVFSSRVRVGGGGVAEGRDGVTEVSEMNQSSHKYMIGVMKEYLA